MVVGATVVVVGAAVVVVVVVVGAAVVVVVVVVVVLVRSEKHCKTFLQSSFVMHFKLSSLFGLGFVKMLGHIAASQSLSFAQVAAAAIHGFEQTKIWEQSAFLKHSFGSPPLCTDIIMCKQVVSRTHA